MGSCDSRCTSGQEGTCACSCGGANHGTAKRIYDIVKDGGNADVKGAGLDLHLAENEDGKIQVWSRGNKVQVYKSEKEFVKDLGKLIVAGQVDVTAQDADSRRQVDLKGAQGRDPEAGKARLEKMREPTVSEAFDQIRATGAKVTRKDGEFRVNVPGGKEATAYFTDDPKDAVETAKVMMSRHAELSPGGEFSHSGIKGQRGHFVASSAATEAWANKSGGRWPGSTIAGHRVSATFEKNGDLVDLEIDGGKTDIESVDGTELNAFLEDVHPRKD